MSELYLPAAAAAAAGKTSSSSIEDELSD